jgi:hypothetical protein
MPDNDFGIVVCRDDGRGAGNGMIERTEAVGEGTVVLLEQCAVGRIGHDGNPRAVLGKRVLHTNEARGCNRPISESQDRYEHGHEQSKRE